MSTVGRAFVVLATLAFPAWSHAGAPQLLEDCGGRPLHPPIEIGGEFGLAGFVVAHDPQSGDPVYRPGAGVVAGSGTAEDPFLIEGWCIQGGPVRTLRYGVRLIDTDAHVVIRDNAMISTRAGVRLDNATNVVVEQNVLWGNLYGVALDRSGGNVVRENLVADTRWEAIHLSGSDGNVVLDNRIEGGREGIGIGLTFSHDNEIRGNAIAHVADSTSYKAGGIADFLGQRNLVAGNLVTDNEGVAIRLHMAAHTVVEDNLLARNRAGVFADDILSVVARNNVVEDHPENGFEMWWWGGGLGIYDNVVRGNGGAGIYLGPDEWPHLEDVVRGNNIERNAGEGIVNSRGEVLDARGNWWGCVGGPEAIACDGVLGAGVAYDPWLPEPNANAGVRT